MSKISIPKICTIDGCNKLLRAKGLCINHYALWKRNGDPLKKTIYFKNKGELCSIDGCEQPCKTKGLCRVHYVRLRTTGRPDRKSFPGDFPMKEKIELSVERITESGCWIWMNSLYGTGYGATYNADGQIAAHRASYEAFNGEIKDGLHVCHKCDVPSCVNPDHLFIGTIKENMSDMVSKGRQCYGEKNGSAVLNECQVIEIRNRLKEKYRGIYTALGREYGVNRSTIRFIEIGKTWKHIE